MILLVGLFGFMQDLILQAPHNYIGTKSVEMNLAQDEKHLPVHPIDTNLIALIWDDLRHRLGLVPADGAKQLIPFLFK